MQAPAQGRRRDALICLVLGLVTLGLYWPALAHGFLDYDDQAYVTQNPHVRHGLGTGAIAWAFGFHVSNWHPLTWLSHMLDCQVYGLRPAGHHLTNLLLHVANSLLLFIWLRRLTDAPWRSAAVAAWFAWHPAHVESVAWIAERKDVLSAFFWFLTLLAWLEFTRTPADPGTSGDGTPVRRRRWVFYLLALVCFALGLMSKPMVVTLPFVLLLLELWPAAGAAGQRAADGFQPAREWPGCRLSRWLELAPFFALSAATCVLTVLAQRRGYSVVSTASLPFSERSAHALAAYGHYFASTFLPRQLAVFYPYEMGAGAGRALLASVLVTTVSALCFWFRRGLPYLLVGWCWFLGTLVPVIGLVQVGDQAWADRYMYLPSIGLFIAAVWLVGQIIEERLGSETRRWLVAPGVGSAVCLCALTTFQLRHWRNSETLFAHAAEVTPRNHLAVTLLGSLMESQGRVDDAVRNYRQALAWQPGYAEAHFFLGHALAQQGKTAEAIAELQQAVRFKPMQTAARVLLGTALSQQGKPEEAVVQYRAALASDPDSVVAHNNLARLLQARGQFEQATVHYRTALALDPALPQAHNNLGVLLLQQGLVSEGVRELREALRANPNDRETQYNLALALNQTGAWTEAVELFAKTVDPAGSDSNAQYQFALALAHLHRTREAMSHYAAALLLRPDFPDALDGLAWILATSPTPEFRNATQAIAMAEHACDLTARRDPVKLRTLAAAYAEAGRFADAGSALESARALVIAAAREDFLRECEAMRVRFAASQPWRDPPSAP